MICLVGSLILQAECPSYTSTHLLDFSSKLEVCGKQGIWFIEPFYKVLFPRRLASLSFCDQILYFEPYATQTNLFFRNLFPQNANKTLGYFKMLSQIKTKLQLIEMIKLKCLVNLNISLMARNRIFLKIFF